MNKTCTKSIKSIGMSHSLTTALIEVKPVCKKKMVVNTERGIKYFIRKQNKIQTPVLCLHCEVLSVETGL